MKPGILIILLAASFAVASPTPDKSNNRRIADEIRLEAIGGKANTQELQKIIDSVLLKAAKVELFYREREEAAAKKNQAIVDSYEKKLQFYYQNPWVRFILFVRKWFYILLGAYVVLGLIGTIGGLAVPGSFLFSASKAIIRFLPFANPFRWLQKPFVSSPPAA